MLKDDELKTNSPSILYGGEVPTTTGIEMKPGNSVTNPTDRDRVQF